MRIENEHVARCTLPGQFVHVRLPGTSLDPLLRRPFSVCGTCPDDRDFSIVYQVVGRGTTLLSTLCPGDELDVLGPLGRGFEMPRARIGREDGGIATREARVGELDAEARLDGRTQACAGRVVLVAGGLGIAPLAMLADALCRAGEGLVLIAGARNAETLRGLLSLVHASGLGRSGLSESATGRETCGTERAAAPGASEADGGRGFGPQDACPTFEALTVTEDGSMGGRGLATDVLRDVLARGRVTCVYASGPAGMLREVARLSEAFGVRAQVSLEERMACGIGACLGCVVRAKGKGSSGAPSYLRVCADGPVFWVEEVDLVASG
jgi:dihydroorotate dehydrogenase electron transfer subunit